MSDDATRIRQALRTIEVCWPEMLPDAPGATRFGTIGRTDSKPGPVPAHVLEVRREGLLRLSGWALVVLDDLDLHPQLSAHDAPGLARFLTIHADYLATIGDEPVDELADTARKVDAIVAPRGHESIPLGDCPLTVAVDGSSVECGGKVRAYADRHFAVCQSCGTEDTILWWESRILGDSGASALADAVALAAHLSRVHYRIVPPSTIRAWASKGLLTRRGKDDKGRTLYDRAEVDEVAGKAFARRVG